MKFNNEITNYIFGLLGKGLLIMLAVIAFIALLVFVLTGWLLLFTGIWLIFKVLIFMFYIALFCAICAGAYISNNEDEQEKFEKVFEKWM